MHMEKKVPWDNFIRYGSFTLLGLAGLICALILDPSPPALISAGSAFLGFFVVFLVVIFKWYFSTPDYTTKQGTAVWTDGLKIIDKGRMETVLDFYIKNLSKYAPYDVSPVRLEYMLKNSNIEWSRKSVSGIGLGWLVKDKAGLQSGKYVKLHWTGSIVRSALYHELHHMVDEIILGVTPDYKHERIEWWSVIEKLKNDFDRQN